MTKFKTPRRNYVVTVIVSDDGSWPRIRARNLHKHIDVKLPSGLHIERMRVTTGIKPPKRTPAPAITQKQPLRP